MVKFQLYLRKLIIQVFYILVQVTIGISRFKWLTSKQITIQLGVSMLLSKKKAFQNADWLNQRFRNYLGSYPWKLHLEVKFLIAFSTKTKGNKKYRLK